MNPLGCKIINPHRNIVVPCGATAMKFLFRSSVSTSIHGADKIDEDAEVICSNYGTSHMRVGYERRMTHIEEQLEQVNILMTWKEGFIDELRELQDKFEDLENRIKNLERK